MCPYCKSKEIKWRIIVSNAFAFAFPTNIPIVPGHILICTKKHRRTLNDLTKKEIHAIFDLQKKLKKALTRAFKAEGFNYAWNENPVAGQNIGHFHLHMLPRKKGDTGIIRYEPRKFLYRPGSREISPDAELAAVAKLIQSKLSISTVSPSPRGTG